MEDVQWQTRKPFYAKQNQLFIDTDCLLLPTDFHLWNITVAQEHHQIFSYLERSSKTLLNNKFWEIKTGLFKGKIHLKCSYTARHKFEVNIVGYHISDKTILLGRQSSVSAATVFPAERIICLFVYLFNGSFRSHLLFGSEMMKFHFLRSLAQHSFFCICQPNLPIRYNVK